MATTKKAAAKPAAVDAPADATASSGDKPDKSDAPAGYAYVVHPKSGERGLVDAKSVPELLVDGYQVG